VNRRTGIPDVEEHLPRAHLAGDRSPLAGSEELNRAVVSALEEGVIVLDADGAAISANESALRILGQPASRILGRRPPFFSERQVFLEDGRRVTAETHPALATLRDGTPRPGVVFRIVDPQGTEHWTSVGCRPLRREAEERPYGLVISLSDVTERMAFERRLREERDRAHRYLELAGSLIVVLDADGRVDVVNQAVCEMLGYAEAEIVGRNWFDTCVPLDSRREQRALRAAIVAGDPVAQDEEREQVLMTRTGEHRIVAWKDTVMRDDHGRVSGTLSSGVDVTDRREAESQVAYLAYHDGLTGLPNRALLEEHLRKAVAALQFTFDRQPAGVTISVGAAISPPERPVSADELFRRADAAMYRAKRAGRDRVATEELTITVSAAPASHAT